MAFTFKILTLYKDFNYSKESGNTDESLTLFKNAVKKGDLEPSIESFLTEELFCGNICNGPGDAAISKGRYAFIQGKSGSEETVKQAAEELYLESLWQELSFTDDRIFMRKLTEDGETVFQLFRQIK